MEIKSYSMNWHYPTAVRVGAGRISELPKACRQLGMTSPLLVTDPGLAALPMVEAALQLCRDAGLQVGLFSAIKGNPTGGNVADGASVAMPWVYARYRGAANAPNTGPWTR